MAYIKPISPANFLPGSPDIITAAEALVLIDSWIDLTLPRRRTLCSAIRTLPRVLKLPLEAILMDAVTLNEAFSRASPASMGVGPGSMPTYLNSIRSVLRRLGKVRDRRNPIMAPQWQALHDSLPSHFNQMGVAAFFKYLSEQAICPHEVTNAHVAAFQAHRESESLSANAAKKTKRVCMLWNHAAKKVPGWPNQSLSAPVKLVRFTKPFDAYPLSFQQDVAAFEARLKGGGSTKIWDLDGPPSELKPGTIKSRVRGIREAAAGLVETGTPPDQITNLGVLVQEANFCRALDFYHHRKGGKKTTHLSGIASALIMVACYHLKLPDASTSRLRALAKKVAPKKRTQMTPKNAHRLAQLDDERIEARLLNLPQHLMREAQALLADGETVRAGWSASVAIAVQLLLVMPVRSENLVELRLDTELLRYDARSSRITHICIPSDQVKNGVRLEFAVHKDVAAMIETYIRSFRAHLPHANSVWLFPARDAADRPRSQGGLAKAVTAAIKRYVGIDMNVHLFRGYAGKVLLDDNPNAIDELRQLLGHKDMATTMMYYTHFKAKKVGQAHIDKMNAKQAVASRSARLPSRFNKPKPRVGKAA